ncbi:MAG: N-acyl homoserine lactonase family protein [Rhodospirillaceae bacterium]|nr:N-acyl homoserine lactonase family protein [Rhodospirillaceae bacterium]
MKMHILSGGRLQMKKQVYLPDAMPDEKITLPVSCYLFRHPQGNVLFDTGCHPTLIEDPEKRWGSMARAVVPVMAKDDNVISELGRVNLTPDDIDIVVSSHFHCDHCGCNEYFSKAVIYVHADEIKRAQDPEMEGRGYFQADWDHPIPLKEFNGEVDVFDDGHIVLLPLPGHTPGLTGLLASLPNSGAYLLASDAVPIRETLDLEVLPSHTWNKDLLTNSLAEIKRIEKSGATVFCGHDLAQSSTFKPPEEFYS